MADLDVISLDEAMTAITMTGSGAKHGEQVSLFVSGISERMDALCGPIVIREIEGEIHYPDPYGNIALRTPYVIEVTSLTEYVAGTGTELDAETLTVEGGFLLRNGLVGRRSAFGVSAWQGAAVSVSYTAGRYETTAEVGARFKLAAEQIIARMWPQYAAAWSRGGVLDSPEDGPAYFRSFDPVLREILEDQLLPRLFAA